MAKPHQRVVALSIALIFLGTVIVSGIAVIWQILEDSKQAETVESLLEQTGKLPDFEPVDKVEKLKIVDITKGDGDTVKEGATITAHYTGALAKDGVIFESSRDTGQPATFSLDGVIAGWQEGVPGMKEGGTRRLVIPAEQAYGAQSPSEGIPPNSDLVFDIEIISIEE